MKRVQVGDAWWREKKVKFLGVRFTTEALRILLKAAETDDRGYVNLRMLPNKFKQDPRQPDFRGFFDFVVRRRLDKK